MCCIIQSLESATASGSGGDREFELASPDGGRTWLPVMKHDQPEVNTFLEAHARPRRVEEGSVSLALVLPTQVSMFPLTPAVRPLAAYLNGGEAQDLPANEDTIGTDGRRLQPLVGVFEAQPFRSGGDHGNIPENFQGVIVISRAVPRPYKVCAFVMRRKSLEPFGQWIAVSLAYVLLRTRSMSSPAHIVA